MAESKQAEALGRGFLCGWERGFIDGDRTAAIFRHGDATSAKFFARLVVACVCVAALEEAGGIEGAASLQVSLAAARSERLQWHGCAQANSSWTRLSGRGAAHGTKGDVVQWSWRW